MRKICINIRAEKSSSLTARLFLFLNIFAEVNIYAQLLAFHYGNNFQNDPRIFIARVYEHCLDDFNTDESPKKVRRNYVILFFSFICLYTGVIR